MSPRGAAMRRRAVLALALAAPLAATAETSRALADRAAPLVARAIALGAGRLGARVDAPASTERTDLVLARSVPRPAAEEGASPQLAADALHDGARNVLDRGPAPGPRAIRVRKEDVLAAIGRGVLPQGIATDRGVRVTAAPGLEAWIRPGDLVTHVAGRAVRSFDAIAAAAMGAHRAHAKAVTGRILRGAQAIDVLVELP